MKKGPLLTRHRGVPVSGFASGHVLARTLLLSLEYLVAADIVRTVLIEERSFTNIGVLGLIILVRTFLGWALEVEINGRWPWRGPSTVASDGQES